MWFFWACARASFDTPIPDDGTFARLPAEGAERERFEAAATYSRDRGGLALMILRGTDVIFEDYPQDAATPVHLYSGTKSFGCALFLAGLADGLWTADEPVADTLTEWADDARTTITVGDLLHFTTGLEDAWWRLSRDGMLEDQAVDDKYALAVSLAQIKPLGTFDYKAADLFVFGAFVAKKTGEDPVDYLRRRVLDPIGMQFAGWMRDPVGNPMLPYGAWTTANEWAKFGVLARDRGVWQGETLLADWNACLVGTKAMPAYGLNWWMNVSLDATQAKEVPAAGITEGKLLPAAPDDVYMAAGHNDQRLYILPGDNLVIVRLGDGSGRYLDDAFLAEVLP